MLLLELFCEASGSKISVAKCILLGWEEHPPNWCTKFGFSWGGSVLNLDSAGVVLTRSLGTLESPFLLILVLMTCGIG